MLEKNNLPQFITEFKSSDMIDLMKVIDAAPKMLKAIIRFQDEWVINGYPAQRANNYSIEKDFEESIKNIFQP